MEWKSHEDDAGCVELTRLSTVCAATIGSERSTARAESSSFEFKVQSWVSSRAVKGLAEAAKTDSAASVPIVCSPRDQDFLTHAKLG